MFTRLLPKLCILCMALLFAIPLAAQRVDLSTIDSFQLDDYRARYDRRPLMTLDGRFNFRYAENTMAPISRSSTFSLNYDWRLARLKDRYIEHWTADLFPFVRWGNQSPTRVNLPSSVGYERQQFVRPDRFIGGSAEIGLTYGSSSDMTTSSSLVPATTLSAYVGGGRIEFAEDALLAAWTLKDLEQADLLPANVDSEAIFAVARTITDLIGNRVFDLRRRRIYELEQLHTTLQAIYPDLPMSIGLFTIVNDNWAFANRFTLPHGQEWRVGPLIRLQASTDRAQGNRTVQTNERNWGGFASWRRARIHRNRTASEFNISAIGEHNFRTLTLFNLNEERFTVVDDLRSSLEASYAYTLFPFSRSLLTASISGAYNRWWDTTDEWRKSAEFWESSVGLTANLFLSYQVNLLLDFRMQADYFPSSKELVTSPSFGVRTFYNIF